MKFKKPKFWDQKETTFLSILLSPLSYLFLVLTNLRSGKKIKYNKIISICVGNMYIGGTGKTSLAIKIKQILDKKNIKTCFIKKYYPDQFDEFKLLEKHGKVFFNKSRTESIEKAIIENYEIVILDDGLQDKSINYDISFVCFNNLNWIGNGKLIPAGPLRESLKNLEHHQNVFLNGNNENLGNIKFQIRKINPQINIMQAKYEPINIGRFNVAKDEYIVFSGIGNHKTFINMLKENNFKIICDLEFPDHYDYSQRDLDKIYEISKNTNYKIITTEKDFLRLKPLNQKKIDFIESELKIIDEVKLMKTLNLKK